jgi:hypothetical protein
VRQSYPLKYCELIQSRSPQPNSIAPTAQNLDVEPGEEWKESLRKRIEESFLPMEEDAMESYKQKLREAPENEATRARLARENNDSLEDIRRMAYDLYWDQVEEERQRLRWVQGKLVDNEWAAGFVKEQQAIIEQIERDKTANSGARSSHETIERQRLDGGIVDGDVIADSNSKPPDQTCLNDSLEMEEEGSEQ